MMIDVNSLTWRSVEKFAREQIEDAHKQLETKGLGLDETNHQRGRIELARELLDLAKPRPQVEELGTDYGLATTE